MSSEFRAAAYGSLLGLGELRREDLSLTRWSAVPIFPLAGLCACSGERGLRQRCRYARARASAGRDALLLAQKGTTHALRPESRAIPACATARDARGGDPVD